MSQVELLIVFFFFVLAAVSAAGYVFVLRPSRTESEAVHLPAALDRDVSDLPTAQAAVLDLFRLIGEALPGPKAQADSARNLLLTAGYRWPSALSVFLGIKCGFALLLATAAVWATMMSHDDMSAALVPAICGLGLGYILPNQVLLRLANARSERLRRALPAALDLMVLAVEAGQGLDAAIAETSRGLRFTHPDLASEFTQLQLELRADTSRVEALRHFAARSRDMEMKKFANLLIETDRFGSSLGPALRTHARYLRTRFRQKAQERARKVSVKLIFPIFFLIFPSVILVTLGPAVILVMGQLKNIFGE
jgi:tight adherence protein C